mmetsp:Transcript_9515/g.23351  ORF Transcript_9515/g.23351 Transcript_9515/m.23351 type:complete len:251 (-) Transcript_9515:831-1583(-)
MKAFMGNHQPEGELARPIFAPAASTSSANDDRGVVAALSMGPAIVLALAATSTVIALQPPREPFQLTDGHGPEVSPVTEVFQKLLHRFQAVLPKAAPFRHVQDRDRPVSDLLAEGARDPRAVLDDRAGRVGVAHDVVHVPPCEPLLHGGGVPGLGGSEPSDPDRRRSGLGLEFGDPRVALVQITEEGFDGGRRFVHGLVADAVVGELVSLSQQPDHIVPVAIRQKGRYHHEGGLCVVLLQEVQYAFHVGV